jgi:hypothetical protein
MQDCSGPEGNNGSQSHNEFARWRRFSPLCEVLASRHRY